MAEKRQGRFRSDVKKGLFQTTFSIARETDAWFQSLSNEMKASGGYKLPKSFILRSLLNAMRKLKIDVSGVKTEEELEARFLEAIKQFKG
mgnify:CR=1 FL=1